MERCCRLMRIESWGLPLERKRAVGSCIVHATEDGYREISVIRGSESRLSGL